MRGGDLAISETQPQNSREKESAEGKRGCSVSSSKRRRPGYRQDEALGIDNDWEAVVAREAG